MPLGFQRDYSFRNRTMDQVSLKSGDASGISSKYFSFGRYSILPASKSKTTFQVNPREMHNKAPKDLKSLSFARKEPF